MTSARLVLATRNPGKVREVTRLLARLAPGWDPISLDDAGVTAELEERGDTYDENAVAKAVAASAATGLPALADDSGIEVDALAGWPGPRSARWLEGSDADRLHALLDEVARRTPQDRRARYVCVIALARTGEAPVTARGECTGVLVEPRGTGGFGYDPAFLSDDLGITFGEAADEEKERVSHRARALARLAGSGVLALSATS